MCTLTLLLATCLSPPGAAALYELPEGKTLSSSSAILVALGATEDEDVVLYEKEADQKRAPAALVRIMVGALALKTIYRRRGLTQLPPPAPTPCSATT